MIVIPAPNRGSDSRSKRLLFAHDGVITEIDDVGEGTVHADDPGLRELHRPCLVDALPVDDRPRLRGPLTAPSQTCAR